MMKKSIFIIAIVVVIVMGSAITYFALNNEDSQSILLVDTHEVNNHSSYYSTLGNVTIINQDTIEITFNNKNDFGLYHNDTKVWSIPGEFEFIKEVKVGQRFITHCFENEEDAVNVDSFELKSIDMLREVITFDHYVHSEENTSCEYPDIILDSYSTSSSGHVGQYIYKMGAGTGLTYGQVTTYYSVTQVFLTNANAAQYDSGGPVYQITGYSNGQYTGKVFGHVTEDLNGALYQPTFKLINNYGIYPATT